ncbi:MAG: DUF3368 domain-containing protein [Hormoscilla sp. GM7CHS1pb]|nr:DUF3368 domain-containing protein [Hormoscilla sp. GM7CHS1pb]
MTRPSLAAINRLHLLQQLYGSVIIPEAVYRELTVGIVPGAREVQNFDWIQTRQVANRTLVAELSEAIDEGESEAIALAIELNAELLLIDDLKARSKAVRLGLDLIGLLAVLQEAKNQGLIPAVKPVLDELIVIAGFRVGRALYDRVLQDVGE